MRILSIILRGWIIFIDVFMGSFEPEKVGNFKPEMTSYDNFATFGPNWPLKKPQFMGLWSFQIRVSKI
jgi:hypothetical protein